MRPSLTLAAVLLIVCVCDDQVVREELGDECDYEREAANQVLYLLPKTFLHFLI